MATTVLAAEADEKIPAMKPVLDAGSLGQLVLSLLLVVMLILAVAWLLKRFGNFSATTSGNLKIIDALSMGTRERIVLLQVGEQQVLLGVSTGHIEMLCTLEKPVATVKVKELQGTFADRFAEALKRGIKK